MAVCRLRQKRLRVRLPPPPIWGIGVIRCPFLLLGVRSSVGRSIYSALATCLLCPSVDTAGRSGCAWAVQSVRFRSGIRVRVLVGFCSAHVLAQFRLRGGMKFIPIGMADMSRRFRPQAGTAGIGTRKPASTPVGVAERWHPYRGAKGIIRFRDRGYRPDGLNHRLMSGNPTGFLELLPSFSKPGTKTA